MRAIRVPLLDIGGPEFMRVLAQEAHRFFRRIEAQGGDGAAPRPTG